MEKETYNYKECMRNHAASLGTYATDGCGEYTPESDSSTLSCAACGCHRNFHRKVRLLTLPVKEGGDRRKRRRTKFTPEQKERMARFADSIDWKIPRKGGDVGRFCGELGVDRQVFRVWMHNHKKEKESSKHKIN